MQQHQPTGLHLLGGWLCWVTVLVWALSAGLKIRRIAHMGEVPSPPFLSFNAVLWTALVAFLFIPVSKFHLLWIAVLMWLLVWVSSYLPKSLFLVIYNAPLHWAATLVAVPFVLGSRSKWSETSQPEESGEGTEDGRKEEP